MEKSIIATGKTIDMAIDAALKQLNLDRDSVSVEIIENAKSGFLGIGAVPAKVKVTYEAPDEAPAPALSSASRSKTKSVAAPAVPEKSAPTAYQPEVRAERKPAPKQEVKQERKQERKQEPKQERKEDRPKQEKAKQKQPKEPRQETPKAPVEYAPAAPGSKEEQIETFVKGLLEHMGNDAVPHCTKTGDDNYLVDLVGSDLGALIGHRGDTLDAIQHLTNYSINRDNDKHTRISVDAENYRRKREEALQRLAKKVAAKVLKYRRNVTLEPMNAYERHVIHATLQDTPNITTFSTGTEPNRRIVVAYNKDGKSE